MLSSISLPQLGIILLIVILIFGTRKLRTLGEDVGGGIQGIREGFGGDLGDAAEEIGRAKKSLEDVQDRYNNPASQSSDGDDEHVSREQSYSGPHSLEREFSSSDWQTEWDELS